MSAAAGYGAFLDALRGVSWPARSTVENVAAGSHHSRLPGLSAEFTEYRPYRQGDDPRRLDWKLLGRTDRAYQRVSTDRGTLPTIIVLDGSRSMAFPVQGRSKWECARDMAVGLVSVAHRDGDPVGVLVAADRVTYLPLRRRRGVVSHVASVLAEIAATGLTPLASVLRAHRLPHRVAVITDLLGDAEETIGLGRELVASGVEVHVLHVVASEELEPEGSFLAFDPEQPSLRRPLVADTREGYRAAFDAWRAEVARGLLAAGAFYTEIVTSEPAARAVRRVTAPASGNALVAV